MSSLMAVLPRQVIVGVEEHCLLENKGWLRNHTLIMI